MIPLPIPLGVDAKLRGLPYATITIIALNILVHLFTMGIPTNAARSAKLEELAAWELEKAATANPAVSLRLAAYPTAFAFLEGERNWESLIAEPESRIRLGNYQREQTEIEAAHPFYRYGFVPTAPTLTRLVAHMFLHGGHLHLLFNMLPLYLVGCVLEDRWGVPLFVSLYVALGAAAAFAHAVASPGSIEPAIGASGAISGLMGAFAVQHARTPIRILLVYGLGLLPRARPMTVPAVAFLGFWFLEQSFYGLLTVNSRVGIAFWAHIGGFVAGVVVAFSIRLLARGELAERLRAVDAD